MTIVLLFIFIVLVAAGLFRAVHFVENVHGDRSIKVSAVRGAPFWVLAVIALLCLMSFVTVDAGSRGVVLRFGATTGRVLTPGLHFIIPFFETVQPISVQVQIEKLDSQASSHDLQEVHTQVTLAYWQDPCCVSDIWSELNNDAVARVVVPAIQEAVKANTAHFDAEQLIANRPVVRDGIEGYVRQRLAAHHINVDAVSITDFSFSSQFNTAIEAKVTAAQNALKAENDLKRIQVEAEQKVTQAKAEAEALNVQRTQITPELLQLRTIEMMQAHWDGHLPDVYIGGANGALPMIDVLKAASRPK
ncbi:MAG TPA: prohibitin family protein [Candidatus Acidoferrales bacterium]|nr:prohibitin family protein [Candidatus Acidoferrales bacterium]